MGIIDEHFTMPGEDMPPQEFFNLKTQQGQINWLAQFLMSVIKHVVNAHEELSKPIDLSLLRFKI